MNNIEDIFKKYEIDLDSSQIEIFGKFLKLFLEKNSHVNLSAIRDEEWVIEKHFIDSVMLNADLDFSWKILDIWTWWWFPWIPLAITNPQSEFVLMDSTRKKIDAVNYFIQELGITNARWVWGRAEDLAKNDEYKKQFDLVVSRATAYLPQIFEWALPFLKKWWMMVFYKQKNESEIQDWALYIERKWFKILEVRNYFIQGQERIFIFIGRRG
ncbi:MAG: hypothetical protein ACD_3C00196G0015 [uncultured bacterium (gcode 4)]|uniref:Ribosomal RNA small subunit methyltransferase G n=1 Tax=uncultured bacterium (gcode 4) TaxID=1234023 RepID=K2G046_9BACT|nr:MAG: hypothetical protein ACD_3C00196G0015 [uncultured bacterium (gcode 4)]